MTIDALLNLAMLAVAGLALLLAIHKPRPRG
jgi:hypothetical protein